jgi:hypothetical protein
MLRELAVVIRIADKLAAAMPRNLHVLQLAHEVRQLARVAGIGKRKRDWGRIKRAQRARARAAKLAQPDAGNPNGK